MKCRIINSDVLEGLAQLETESIQTCVTSPPYWGLRDYGIEGQLGLESTPEAHVEAIVGVFREVRRVLRKDGTLWLNYGDCYGSGTKGSGGDTAFAAQKRTKGMFFESRKTECGVKDKDLVGLPWMVAFALRQDGWYLRSDIIWSKPNPMPESVTDRPTKSHEYIFILTKSPTYFYDAQAIAEPMKYTGLKNQTLGGFEPAEIYNGKNGHKEGVLLQDALDKRTYTGFNKRWDESMAGGAVGISDRKDSALYQTRNKRTVWTIPTQPFPESHFAVFPEDLIKPCILAGTSERGCCSKCGAPWERDIDIEKRPNRDNCNTQFAGHRGVSGGVGQDARTRVLRGWSPTCKHDASVVPCTVLDPFSGSGTVGLVSMQYGRDYVGIELNPEYVKMQERRLHSVVSQEILTFD